MSPVTCQLSPVTRRWSLVKCQMSPVTHGYITLISVLVVGAVGMAITTSLILLGIGNSRTGFTVQQSYQTKALANACAEEGLEKIRGDSAFTGTETLSLGQGNCTYTVTSQGGQNRTVTAVGTVGTVVRKARVIVSGIGATISLSSWQEVSDF